MREHLGFLKTSSAVVKITAWIFLLIGVYGGLLMLLGRVQADSYKIIGAVLFIVSFFFLYLMAKIADLLIKIIHEIKKEE